MCTVVLLVAGVSFCKEQHTVNRASLLRYRGHTCLTRGQLQSRAPPAGHIWQNRTNLSGGLMLPLQPSRPLTLCCSDRHTTHKSITSYEPTGSCHIPTAHIMLQQFDGCGAGLQKEEEMVLGRWIVPGQRTAVMEDRPNAGRPLER